MPPKSYLRAKDERIRLTLGSRMAMLCPQKSPEGLFCAQVLQVLGGLYVFRAPKLYWGGEDPWDALSL